MPPMDMTTTVAVMESSTMFGPTCRLDDTIAEPVAIIDIRDIDVDKSRAEPAMVRSGVTHTSMSDAMA